MKCEDCKSNACFECGHCKCDYMYVICTKCGEYVKLNNYQRLHDCVNGRHYICESKYTELMDGLTIILV